MTPSSTPNASPSDPNPVVDKEKKADANGYLSPAAEPKHEREAPKDKLDDPLVNGKSSPVAAVTNGAAADSEDAKKEEVTEESELQPPSTETSAAKTEKNITTASEAAEENKAEEPAVEKEDSSQTAEVTAQKSEDVQMTDDTNAIDSTTQPPPPAHDESASKPSSTSPESKSPATTTKEPDADTVMTDDNKPSEKPPEQSSKSPSKAEEPSEVDLGPASISQLAIVSSAETSPVDASMEVSMKDAAPSVKVVREREDDFGEQPAPKRAKTEPKEEEPSSSFVAPEPSSTAGTPAPSTNNDDSGGAGSGGLDRLAALARWEDAVLQSRKITSFQRRETRKIIGRVKKTKNGAHFRDSVAKLWPQLGESYLARIDKPMDLSEIDRNLRDPSVVYSTFGDMRKDLALIYENTLAFNGATHEVTQAAYSAIRTVWQESIVIPEEEPVRPKSVAKPKPPREHRVMPGPEAVVRRQSSGPASSPPPRDVPEAKPRPSAAAQDHNADRRSSTATEADNRPKRTVRAPKPKDIDYTTKPTRKKLKPELQFCDEVLAELMHPKNQALNTWFMDAVDAAGLNIPHYYSVIKKPMDLGKVLRMLNGGEITSLKDFDKNVRQIFANCYEFNGPPEQSNPVSILSRQLEDLYNQQMKGRDAWLARYAKTHAPPPSASNASDDEDEGEGDEDDASAAVVDKEKEIQELNKKLDEESKKLNAMFASGTNQSLIECQKRIVETVQGMLYSAAQTQGDAKSKQDKPVKKSSKPSKNKTSSSTSAPSRKVTSHAPPPKKSTGTKKAAPKKSLTAADKDQIASAINDLEYPHLERAIDIIKRDTGQNENNDGELELDIDQLSNEAVLKLWELCKKVLPGFGKDSTTVAAAPRSPEFNRPTAAKPAAKAAPKPKKNKPMSAQEQEARIAQLTAISQLYKEPTDDLSHGLPMNHQESSDDSDSEEE